MTNVSVARGPDEQLESCRWPRGARQVQQGHAGFGALHDAAHRGDVGAYQRGEELLVRFPIEAFDQKFEILGAAGREGQRCRSAEPLVVQATAQALGPAWSRGHKCLRAILHGRFPLQPPLERAQCRGATVERQQGRRRLQYSRLGIVVAPQQVPQEMDRAVAAQPLCIQLAQ